MKAKPLTCALVFICTVSVLASCVPPAAANETDKAAPVNLAPSYTSFGFDLYGELLKGRFDENVFISPASIAFALAMAQNGAANATETAMSKTLHLEGMSRDEINEANSSLIGELHKAEPEVVLSIANSMWLKEGIRFYEEFVGRNEKSLDAEAFIGLDIPRINEWVGRKTKNKITKILEVLPQQTIAVLINAIYFKGTWEVEFDKKLTKEEDFHLPGGRTKSVPMMRRSDDFQYMETDDFQGISLPYGDGRISMYIFLPAESSSLNEFSTHLGDESWNGWMAGLHRRKGMIVMPRFKVEFYASLKRTLRNLGMDVAFSPKDADFSSMCPVSHDKNVYISDVLHKTFAEVNEEGTEAAAVTAVVMGVTSSAEMVRPFRMVVDRPFFFAIRDNMTGLILFMGQVVNPA
jgi:serine protease inhibitor